MRAIGGISAGAGRRARTAETAGRSGTARTTLAGVALVAVLALAGCSLLPGGSSAEGTGDAPAVGELPTTPAGTAESFGEQQPVWEDCAKGMQCADVFAPLDWDDPAGETLTLRMVRHQATGDEKLGTLFVNPGGPGASGVDYVTGSLEHAVQPDVRAAYDVVGWDPRGVGASSPVQCFDAAGMDDFLFGDEPEPEFERGSDEWIEAEIAATRPFGEACAERSGELLSSVSSEATVRDLDMLRAIVGDPKLNFLGFSYGTYIGALYADTFPDHVGRLVLDGAMDPSTSLHEVVREQTRGFELALRAYVADCLDRRGCPFTGTVDGAMGQIGKLLDRIDATPLQGSDGRTLTSGTALTAIITPLYSQESWGYLDQLFTSLTNTDADVALTLADFYYDREDGKYLSNSTEAFTAINCLDYPGDVDPERMRAEAAELDEIAPTIGRFQGYGDIGCAAWPVSADGERAKVTGAGADPILVVGTTGDPATPYRWAESLAKQLESGVLVTYIGEGHTAYTTSDCIAKVVDDYLLKGTVPEQDPRCAAE